MSKNIKLSDKQKEVMLMMRSGWELGMYKRQLNSSALLPDRYKLQNGGLGKGGEVRKVSYKTFSSLIRLNLIYPRESLPVSPQKYYLTELGKSIEL